MNKVVNINLGGMVFVIDEDAYEALDHYLNAIHRHFRSSEGYEEIMEDIEARMGELFKEEMGKREIVNIRNVEAAIAVMGTPEEFGAEAEDTTGAYSKAESKGSTTTKRAGNYRTGKRLFRDPDESVAGGVCAGIAAYFGIADPLWVRLAFIILMISGGFSILVYIVLWAILPEAETAGDRLAMKGEPINVSNIGRIIEEEIRNISTKVEEGFSKGKKKVFSKKKTVSEDPTWNGESPW